MEIQLKTKLSKVLSKDLCKEIFSESRLKSDKFKKIKENDKIKYSWISDDKFIFDLIELSIFYRRVILPMSDTIEFFHMINDDSKLKSEQRDIQGNQKFVRKKIVIGGQKIGSSEEEVESEVNISELQKIIDDFDSVLRIINIQSKIFQYESIDQFLENLKPLLGGIK